jgi:hypothetical protein
MMTIRCEGESPKRPEDWIQENDYVIEILRVAVIDFFPEQRFRSFHLKQTPIVPEVPIC